MKGELLVGNPYLVDVEYRPLTGAEKEVNMIGEILNIPPLTGTKAMKHQVLKDYVLKISDVLDVKVSAELVVLSTSYSARGQINPEGVVGIARAFLAAGADSGNPLEYFRLGHHGVREEFLPTSSRWKKHQCGSSQGYEVSASQRSSLL